MGNFNSELNAYNVIPRELVFDSELSDRARFVYVYMACKPDGWEFFLEPMSKEMGYSKDTLRKYINELVEHGWLIKGLQKNESGVFSAVTYELIAMKSTDSEIFRHGKNMTQDNIDEKENVRKKEKALKKKEDIELFEKCWIAYDRKGSKKVALERWLNLKDDERQRALVHIPFYMKSNERKYLKDFERYISNKVFDSIVIDHKTGVVLYDPEREKGQIGYTPTCGGALSWNDYYKCFMYTGYWDGKHIADGYDDHNRPNGATIMLNNGRGTIRWNSETKTWEKV